MDQIVDKLSFTGLKELWKVMITDYTIDELCDELTEIDNEDELYK